MTFYSSAWVSGMRITSYCGPLIVRTNSYEDLYEALCQAAEALGANAVVSVETVVDPWQTPELWSAGGGAVWLEAM